MKFSPHLLLTMIFWPLMPERTTLIYEAHTGKTSGYEGITHPAVDTTPLTIGTVAAHLVDIPLEIVWAPDNRKWFTEQSGTVSKVDPRTGEQKYRVFNDDKFCPGHYLAGHFSQRVLIKT